MTDADRICLLCWDGAKRKVTATQMIRGNYYCADHGAGALGGDAVSSKRGAEPNGGAAVVRLGRFVTDEDKQKICELRARGLSADSIAAKIGRHRSCVYDVLRDARGGAPPRRGRKGDGKKRAKIDALAKNGLTSAEIARQIGLSQKTIQYHLRRIRKATSQPPPSEKPGGTERLARDGVVTICVHAEFLDGVWTRLTIEEKAHLLEAFDDVARNGEK